MFSCFHPRVHAYALNIQESETCAPVSLWFLLEDLNCGISAKGEQRQSKEGKTANIHLSVLVQDAPEQAQDTQKTAAPE